MKKFKLTNVADNEVVGTYDTKVEAIEAMNETIDETNETNDETEEEGLSPFDFKIEILEINDATTLEEARKYLGLYSNIGIEVVKRKVNGNFLQFEDFAAFARDINPHHMKALVALNKLFTIAEAWNKADGFVPDFSDRSQWKYFPWFKWSDDAAGLVYASTSSTASDAYANVGSRLCFKSESRARQFGKMYADLYNDVFLLND